MLSYIFANFQPKKESKSPSSMGFFVIFVMDFVQRIHTLHGCFSENSAYYCLDRMLK